MPGSAKYRLAGIDDGCRHSRPLAIGKAKSIGNPCVDAGLSCAIHVRATARTRSRLTCGGELLADAGHPPCSSTPCNESPLRDVQPDSCSLLGTPALRDGVIHKPPSGT